MEKLHIYGGRTDNYLSCFKRYVGNAKVIVDTGAVQAPSAGFGLRRASSYSLRHRKETAKGN